MVNLYPWRFPKFSCTTPWAICSCFEVNLTWRKRLDQKHAEFPPAKVFLFLSDCVSVSLLYYSTNKHVDLITVWQPCYNALEPLSPIFSRPDFHVSQIWTPWHGKQLGQQAVIGEPQAKFTWPPEGYGKFQRGWSVSGLPFQMGITVCKSGPVRASGGKP